MAAPKENSLSLRRGIGMERNIFMKQREHSQNNSISVLQHLEGLKKRELAAKLHNRQLLQQFEEAQDTLRSMLTLTASMRTIRMEYERCLEYERFPLRQQQLWERRQAAHIKKNTSDEVVTAPADQMITTAQAYYNQDRCSNLTYTTSPWLSCLHPQLRCPVNVPSQPHQLQQLASLIGQNDKAWPSQNVPDQASLQSDHPRTWLAGNQSAPDAMWGQLNLEDATVEKEALQPETSGESSSKTERCTSRSCSSYLSRELDDKPVRLSDIPAESSSESSQVSSSRRKEKRATSRNSSESKGSISHKSSKTSSVTITAKPCKVSQKSDSSMSSEEDISRSMRRREKGGHVTEIERNKKARKDRNREEVEEVKEEKVHFKSNKSKMIKEGSGSQEEEKQKSSSDNIRNVDRDFSSSEEVSAEVDKAEEEQQKPPKEREKDCGDDVNVDSGEEVPEKLETEDASERQNSTDEEETQQEEEMEEQESDEEGDRVEQSERLSDAGRRRSRSPTSPQGEKESEGQSDGGEGKDEERGESDQEGEASEEGEEMNKGVSDQEESNSDDSIISPQSRSKELQSTQEDKGDHDIEDDDDDDDDDDEGSTSEKSEESSDDDDIEQLLAPQEAMEEKLEEQEEKETTKAFCKVQSFQVKGVDLAKTDDPCDSDEYDDFYD